MAMIVRSMPKINSRLQIFQEIDPQNTFNEILHNHSEWINITNNPDHPPPPQNQKHFLMISFWHLYEVSLTKDLLKSS